MTNRPLEKDQVYMVVRNLHGWLLQNMIVLSLFNFKDLHEIGVQIENAIRHGIIIEGNEPMRKLFTPNATPNNSTGANVILLEINTVTTFTKMANLFTYIDPQLTISTQPRNQRFHSLHVSLTYAMKKSSEKGTP